MTVDLFRTKYRMSRGRASGGMTEACFVEAATRRKVNQWPELGSATPPHFFRVQVAFSSAVGSQLSSDSSAYLTYSVVLVSTNNEMIQSHKPLLMQRQSLQIPALEATECVVENSGFSCTNDIRYSSSSGATQAHSPSTLCIPPTSRSPSWAPSLPSTPVPSTYLYTSHAPPI